jgi:hypothetical protein
MSSKVLPLSKQLTPAQKKKMMDLIQAQNIAIGRVNEFVQYLRDEHNASETDFDLKDINIGFERKKKEETK